MTAPATRTPRRATAVRAKVWTALLAGLTVLVTGCATGQDAVAQGGTFDFVSPGGKTTLTYDPADTRGTIGNLTGPDLLTGEQITLGQFQDEVVVINLWGQWCGPCRAEAGTLQKVYADTKDTGVQFLGINVKDPQQDKPRDFVRDNNITYPSIYDPSMRSLIALGSKYPTSVIPSTIVLDREHRVAAVFLQTLTADDLLPVVTRLAAESP
ncbi:TlpA disulfide reductase family protein [Rhodococcus sp. X156]|uniref:TlpA disulfide reductase family protein n=1 Tax=Rhodococcus sp. X156 TaxID=2499145 RepID=UPI000FD92169|nr:TlpA disulfide reductase family protein [Rhodococcus sp. X156]